VSPNVGGGSVPTQPAGTPTTPPPGTYAATDAQGNTVYLCDPDIDPSGKKISNKNISCLTGGKW
jgi:hypothetical protein